MIGAAAVRKTVPEIKDMIQLHKATGNYQDAISCYNQIRADPIRSSPLEHLFCYLDIGLPKAAADSAAAYLKEDSSLSELLAPVQVHAGEIGYIFTISKFK